MSATPKHDFKGTRMLSPILLNLMYFVLQSSDKAISLNYHIKVVRYIQCIPMTTMISPLLDVSPRVLRVELGLLGDCHQAPFVLLVLRRRNGATNASR